MTEIFAAGENSAQQDRGVDGGDFRIPDSLAGVDVRPMKEKPAMGGHLLPKKLQAGKHADQDRARRAVAALVSDTERREAEAGGGNARNNSFIRRQRGIAAILYQARVGVGLFPEKEEAGLFQLIQKGVVFDRELWVRRDFRGSRACQRRGGWRPDDPLFQDSPAR